MESTLATLIVAFVGAASAIIVALIQTRKEKIEQPTGIHLVKPLAPKKKIGVNAVMLFIVAAVLVGFIGGLLSNIRGRQFTAIDNPNLAQAENNTTSNGEVVPLESLSTSIYVFDENVQDREHNISSGSLSVRTYSDSPDPFYLVSYSTPITKNPNNGLPNTELRYMFSEIVDFTPYKYIVFTIIFKDQQTECSIDIWDENSDYALVFLKQNETYAANINASVIQTLRGKEVTIEIPIASVFGEIDLKKVQGVGFYANSELSGAPRKDYFIISGVKLKK